MQASPPAFVALGLDHRTAGIELRERFAFADGDIPAALRWLTSPSNPLLEQVAILSTCNRVELYGVSRSRGAERELASFLAGYRGLETSTLASALCVYRGDQVGRHLAATAAGLESVVPGEAQILGQVRKALRAALTAGTAGTELRRLFEAAIAAGRRVRSETAIGRGAASVPSAGVDFARRRLGTLIESTVLIIGTGNMAELAAKHVVKCGPKQLLVCGRAPSHAMRIAATYRGVAIASDLIDEALAQADVVISATGAPQPIVSKDQLRLAVEHRSGDPAPKLLIDLSVPRNLDPAVASLPGVELRTVDDLRGSVEHALSKRHAEIPKAYAILESEIARFNTWLVRREDCRSIRRHTGVPSQAVQVSY